MAFNIFLIETEHMFSLGFHKVFWYSLPSMANGHPVVIKLFPSSKFFCFFLLRAFFDPFGVMDEEAEKKICSSRLYLPFAIFHCLTWEGVREAISF